MIPNLGRGWALSRHRAREEHDDPRPAKAGDKQPQRMLGLPMPDESSVPVLPPPLPVEGLPIRRWRLWTLLVLVVPYPLVIGLIGASRPDEQGPVLSGGWRNLLMVCGVELAIFGLIMGIACSLSRTTRDDLLLRVRNLRLILPLGIGYSIALRIGLGVVGGLVVGIIMITQGLSPQALEELMKRNGPQVEKLVNIQALTEDPVYYWLTLTFVSFVVAGLREELWRAASLSALSRLWPRQFSSRGGSYAAVVLTSVLFGIGHLPMGWIAVGGTTFLGIALGSIMVYHRSIWPAVIAHGMFDATSFALLPLVAGQLGK